MSASIILQNPQEGAEHLVLLFHGVGALPENMVTLGRAIAQIAPKAAIISVASPDPSDFSGGYQWFSVRGITEENRPARIAGALPRFVDSVLGWQLQTHVMPEATILIGFSQGGIMALEATQQSKVLAARLIGLSTRFASPPRIAPWAPVHLIHGDQDTVISPDYAEQAYAQIKTLGGSATLDIIPGLAHQINHSTIDLITAYLTVIP